MYDIERIATILKPTQLMLDWLIQQPGQDKNLSLDELRTDCTALLIPIFEDEDQATEYLSNIYEGIFANELATWNPDQSAWPEFRTFDIFLDWFDLEYHSLVFDLISEEEEDEAIDSAAGAKVLQ